MLDAEIISEFYELVRDAKHKEMHIDVDEYRAEFHVYDFSEKPAKLIGSCSSVAELMSIVHNTWKDENGNWVSGE